MIYANFNAYANYVTDSLYQWDINQDLVINGLGLSEAPEIHFANANMDRAIVRAATLEAGVITVRIPNSLLQAALPIKAYVGVYEGDTFKVVETISIPVIAKTKPFDYSFEDTDGEIYSFNKLEREINEARETLTVSERNLNESKSAYDEAVVEMNETLNETLATLQTARIAYGSYVGTGTYGEDKPLSLAFDFVPKLLVVGAESDDTKRFIALHGQTLINTFYEIYTYRYEYNINLVWNDVDKTVLWSGYYYDTEDKQNVYGASAQFNEQGKTYYYVAIG